MVTSKLRQWILTYDPTSEQESLENDEVIDEVVEALGKLLKVCFAITVVGERSFRQNSLRSNNVCTNQQPPQRGGAVPDLV